MFDNREQAADQLVNALRPLVGPKPLVLAIPRGAVPMARIIAAGLHGDLDVILVRKLGAPGNAEFAIGAVDETGHVDIGDWVAGLGVSQKYLDAEAERQRQRLRDRRRMYTPVRSPLSPAGREVIVVDDGVATGATMTIALESVRRAGAKRVIAAVAVAPPEALRALESVADAVVCLNRPVHFQAVGQFFRDFRQIDDDEVVAELQAFRGQS